MFEDATFESTGRIRTRSRGWMIATFFLNGSIVLAMVLIPLIHPEALPRHFISMLVPAPDLKTEQAKPVQVQTAQQNQRGISANLETFSNPRRIDLGLHPAPGPDEPPAGPIAMGDPSPGLPGGSRNPFPGGGGAPNVKLGQSGPARLPSSLVAGLLINKVTPPYPVIAKTAGVQGTVVLQATISSGGTIENLRVISGPVMLQQAAIDAVKRWRYRPYLLNGVPVEVETTVSVDFRLNE